MKHPAQEPDRIPGGAVTGVGIGVIVATVIGVVVMFGIERCRFRQIQVETRTPPPFTGDINAMETLPYSMEAQGLAQHAREDKELESYGWVEREQGILHIPIEAAFELYLQQRGGKR